MINLTFKHMGFTITLVTVDMEPRAEYFVEVLNANGTHAAPHPDYISHMPWAKHLASYEGSTDDLFMYDVCGGKAGNGVTENYIKSVMIKSLEEFLSPTPATDGFR